MQLNGANYLVFLQQVLSELLEELPLEIRRAMWFQHDGAPAHFDNEVCAHLNDTFGSRWVGRGGPIAWPPRSPDLTPLDFFCWGHMKSLVYETPVETQQDLVARIQVAAGIIRDMPGIFPRVRHHITDGAENVSKLAVVILSIFCN